MSGKTSQKRIYNTIKNLEALPRVVITWDGKDEPEVIKISHTQEFVPDFSLVWCPNKQHYRVYICIAGKTYGKTNAGYCICTISNGFAATGLVMVYSFLHKHRANNRSEAESS